jgi:hypothetical protein
MSDIALKREHARDHLRGMLVDTGLVVAKLDLATAWDVFVAYCAIPIEDTQHDGVIVQWGPDLRYKRDGGLIHAGFYYAVIRQFDDEFAEDHEQVELSWHYRLNHVLETVETANTEWCFAKHESGQGCDMAAFLRGHRNSALFRLVEHQTPLWSRLVQQHVE